MSDSYNEVHVLDDKEQESYKEINPEYVYLTIPADYVCVYHKLLTYMADFGKTIVDDCSAICKGNSKNIITCWNLFQSAIACRTLGRDKEAEFFIDYIEKQLELIYKGSGKTIYKSTVPLAVTEDGKLKAIVSCGNDVKFIVDTETGELYEQYLESKDDGKVYTVEDNDLIATDTSATDADVDYSTGKCNG